MSFQSDNITNVLSSQGPCFEDNTTCRANFLRLPLLFTLCVVQEEKHCYRSPSDSIWQMYHHCYRSLSDSIWQMYHHCYRSLSDSIWQMYHHCYRSLSDSIWQMYHHCYRSPSDSIWQMYHHCYRSQSDSIWQMYHQSSWFYQYFVKQFFLFNQTIIILVFFAFCISVMYYPE